MTTLRRAARKAVWLASIFNRLRQKICIATLVEFCQRIGHMSTQRQRDQLNEDTAIRRYGFRF
ncbi:hypothetical protein [Paraburkholderia sp. RAU2J]|uniref:hypothetical protein n=1 Tax=Paraburkholderia sp. RAU2J TaxID=1938810 RepID=UPI0011C457C9|nr:hypothetical protein [Paraburkholderia sp. RAU2J]